MSTVVESVTVGNVRVTIDDEGTVRLQGFVVNDGTKALGFTELHTLLEDVYDAGRDSVDCPEFDPGAPTKEDGGGYYEWIE